MEKTGGWETCYTATLTNRTWAVDDNAKLTLGRSFHTVTAVGGGRLVALGGYDRNYAITDTVEVWRQGWKFMSCSTLSQELCQQAS